MRRALETLLCGVAVYVLVAACSASEGRERAADRVASTSSTVATGGNGGARMADASGPFGGASGVGGQGGQATDTGPGLVDRMVNPVPDVRADTAPVVTVDEVPCQAVPNGDSGPVYYFAEKSYPGATWTELSKVTAIAVVISTASTGAPPGYALQHGNAWVRDGSLSVLCGWSGGQYYSAVRFVRSI